MGIDGKYTVSPAFLVPWRRMTYAPTKLDYRVFGRYLADGEELLAVIHRHWFAVTGEALQALLLGVVLPTVLLAGFREPWWLVLGALIWVTSGVVWLAYVVFDWFADAFVLTSQNVLLLVWKNPVNVTFTRIEYPLIEAVEHERKGFSATVFRYGSLKLTTPNDTHTLDNVPSPHLAEARLLTIRDEVAEALKSEGDGHTDVEALKRALKALLAEERGEKDPDEEIDPKPPEPPLMTDVRRPQ